MCGYSVAPHELSAGLRTRNLYALIALASELSLRKLSYFRRRYRQVGTEFGATLSVAIELGLCQVVGDEVIPLDISPTVVFQADEIVSRAMKSKRLGGMVKSYLQSFWVEAGQIISGTRETWSSDDRGMRDLLMDLEVVKFDRVRSKYVIQSQFGSLYVDSIQKAAPISPTAFALRNEQNHELGRRVEILILEYERLRVGQTLRNQIFHTSAVNVAAGFDIESFSLAGPAVCPRYIEVKAVPGDTFRFFWTENEISVARSLRTFYYLYLVPILRDGNPDMDNLRIICDPAEAVLSATTEWSITSQGIRCERILSMERC